MNEQKPIETVSMKIADVKKNPNNPRIIKDAKFINLVNSIKEFPEMLNVRPIVLNKDHVIIGGNMRFQAAMAAGLTEIPAIIAYHFTDKQEAEFVVKDNLNFGEWDYDKLANDFNVEELVDWGMDAKEFGITDAPKFEFEDDGVTADLPDSNSDVKMVQLFFNTETQAMFVQKISHLMEHFGAENITDATEKAVEYAYNKIIEEAN